MTSSPWWTASAPRRLPASSCGLDEYYEDQQGAGGRRIATQLARQLAEPAPYDLSDVDLRTYRRLDERWRDWDAVAAACASLAAGMLTGLTAEEAG